MNKGSVIFFGVIAIMAVLAVFGVGRTFGWW